MPEGSLFLAVGKEGPQEHTPQRAVLPPSCPQLRLQLLAEYGIDPVTEQVGMGAAGCLVHALGRRMLNVPTHPA